jgi:hypothetical protein
MQEALRPVSLGVSADVAVGQKVYAIGNPFGLDHTLTTGIVSGIHREIQSGITGRPIQDAIQVYTSPHACRAAMAMHAAQLWRIRRLRDVCRLCVCTCSHTAAAPALHSGNAVLSAA